MQILIDGYNLLHAIGFRGDLAAPGELERARLEMLEKLAGYLDSSQRRKTTVIFDRGHRSSDKPQQYTRSDIHVEFAFGFDDADAMIESMIKAHAVPQKLLVVSSDHRIQNAARRRKVDFIDSDEWIDGLEHPPRKQSQKTSSDKPKLREGTEYWLKLFKAASTKEPETDSGSVPSTGSDDDPDAGSDEKSSDEKSSYNPFPDGYGEDLLDME